MERVPTETPAGCAPIERHIRLSLTLYPRGQRLAALRAAAAGGSVATPA